MGRLGDASRARVTVKPEASARTDSTLIIVTLRALICRAAQKDSLRWWDDEALTPYAPVILDRLFPRTGRTAALRIAMEAVRSRYPGALPSQQGLIHLFALDDETEAALATADLSLAEVPPAPVMGRDDLRVALGDHLTAWCRTWTTAWC